MEAPITPKDARLPPRVDQAGKQGHGGDGRSRTYGGVPSDPAGPATSRYNGTSAGSSLRGRSGLPVLRASVKIRGQVAGGPWPGRISRHCYRAASWTSYNDVESKDATSNPYVPGVLGSLQEAGRACRVSSKASPEALARAAALDKLVARGAVSGLVDEGLHTAVHRAVIDAGGRTIAVLGASFDSYYPARNRHLQERTVWERLVASGFRPRTPTRPTEVLPGSRPRRTS
ncbi:MAG: DNA-processing protein DprA [Planctomycetota bacterium]